MYPYLYVNQMNQYMYWRKFFLIRKDSSTLYQTASWILCISPVHTRAIHCVPTPIIRHPSCMFVYKNLLLPAPPHTPHILLCCPLIIDTGWYW